MSRRLSLRVVVFAATLLAVAPASAQDQGAVAASQEVRIQQLEGQIRDLNGQLEQMTYQVQQMSNRLDKLVADVDFRLRGLEGGGGAGMSMGDTGATEEPPAAMEQQQSLVEQPPSPPSSGTAGSGGTGQPKTLGTMSQSQFEAQSKQLNRSADPSAAAAAAGQMGSTVAGSNQTAATGPYALEGATADEQYQYAFDLLRQNKYGDAEQALRTFVDQYPEHPLAGNASYWLGETFYVRQDYDNAALTFAEGFQKYPQSGKAPDSLLKLGMSLAALGETADACKAFGEVTSRYPKASDSVKQRVAKEQSKNGCQ